MESPVGESYKVAESPGNLAGLGSFLIQQF
jgi:hypothetical protein